MVVEVTALPKQLEFLRAGEREVLYSGAFGAGKSRAVCLKLMQRASVPGAVEGLCRKTLVALRKTTLRTLLEPEGELPPVLPPGTYDHNKSEMSIRIRGGGTILYFGLDEPEKLGSMNLSGVGVDEAVDVDEDDWTMLRGRIRLQIRGMGNQIYAACNPGPPTHWLAARFGLGLGAMSPQPNCRAITTKSTDNHFLPRDYVADLMTYTGLRLKRYVLGQWVGSDGLVYDRWDRSVHAKPRDGDWARIVVGVDDGYTHPAAVLRVGIDGDGRAHVIDEVYGAGMQRDDKLAAIRRLAVGAEMVVVDSAAAELIGAIQAEGMSVVGAEKGPNSVFDQVTQVVQPRLLDAGDGRPRLTVDPGCENLIREFESYEWRQGKDEPVKEHDHALDALRYALKYVQGGGERSGVALLEPAASPIDRAMADDRMWNTGGWR